MNNTKSWNLIRDDIDKLIKIKGAVENKNINTANVTAKEAELKNLLALRKTLVGAVSDIDTRIDNLHKSIILDHMDILASLTKIGIKADVVDAPRQKKQMPIAPLKLVSSSSDLVSDVSITPTMSLSAISVRNISDVVADGRLYYVHDTKCFAIQIAGKVYRGNVGKVFAPGEKSPYKVKECRFGNKCTRINECEYYHGPPDVRNYVSTRRFGNLDTLDVDMMKMGPEDIKRNSDLLMHDILCDLLLQKYKNFGGN